MAQKWNRQTHQYEPYTIPDGWVCPVLCWDMDALVNCACCGKSMTFGEGFTSSVIHTEHGMGYSVCEECKEKEMADEREARKEKHE